MGGLGYRHHSIRAAKTPGAMGAVESCCSTSERENEIAVTQQENQGCPSPCCTKSTGSMSESRLATPGSRQPTITLETIASQLWGPEQYSALEEYVSQLLSQDSCLNVDDQTEEKGATALHLATERGLTQLVSTLIDAKADARIQDNAGRTPLHYAAEHLETRDSSTCVDVIELLLSAKCDPDTGSEHADTALHIAARRGKPEIARALLKGRAHPDHANEAGATPYAIVLKESEVLKTGQRSEGHHRVIQLLADARVDIGTQLVKGNNKNSPLAQEVRKISQPIKPRSSVDLTIAENKYRTSMMTGLGDAVT